MPPPPRHRVSTSARPSATTPMSERQQMALLMQMTSSSEAELSPNSQTPKPKDRNERGETALHICAKKGDLEAAKKLLESGVSPNVTDFAGWTPLHEATNHGHLATAQLLIKHGANVNAPGLDDVTPLHDAASFGTLKLVKLLIDKGADPHFKNKKGKTPQDIAHASLAGFFAGLSSDMANKRDPQTQQSKKPSSSSTTTTASGEVKKTNESEDGVASTSAPSDVYEFVSTPKHSSCSSGSGDENPSKNSDKSSDEKSGAESDTQAAAAGASQKRALGDQQEGNEESASQAEEDAKRKKRKDSEQKEAGKPSSAGNRVASRVGQKPPGPASKTMGLVNKPGGSSTTASDRKSPCEILTKSPESEADNEDGPKVPPLKIVIPQQAGTTEQQEASQVNNQRVSNKTTTSRNHPYVVASSNSNDGTGSDKDGGGTGRASPSAESSKSDDTSKSTGKSKEPRILRSSRKDAKDDRGSNNSSPQLPASSTPSPATQMDNTAGNDPENAQSTQSAQSSSTASSSTSSVTLTTLSVSQNSQQTQNPVELHPRKRKIKASSREPSAVADCKDANSKDGQEKTEPVHPHDQPFTNCYQMYLDLRKQIEQRHRNLQQVEPRPLKGLEDYLMNRRTYLLQGKNTVEPNIQLPPLLPPQMKDTFTEQEKERHKLKLRHIVEKEKLVLSKEQEILRVHCKAAQMIANQSQPFSVSTILKDEEVYNLITPEQEEKYRNKNRERSHGRVFYQALKELDDKYDKIKEAMIIRHTNEAESLAAVQKMNWLWNMKELALCEYKTNPEIEELFVPMIDVSDEYTTPSIKD